MVLNVSFCLDLVVWFVDIVCGFFVGLLIAFVCGFSVGFVTSGGTGDPSPTKSLSVSVGL